MLAETVSNSREGSRFPFLVPLLRPGIRADTVGVLPQRLALSLVTGLLDAQKPLVVAIPAVKGLVLGGETLVAGSGSDLLDHGEDSALLLVHVRGGGEKDLGSGEIHPKQQEIGRACNQSVGELKATATNSESSR